VAPSAAAEAVMKRGPIIHGVLLVAMLIFAYQTWTREEKKEPKIGTVKVWGKEKGKLTTLLFETKDRTVRVEERAEGNDKYLWGKEIRVTHKHKRPPKRKTPADAGPEPAKPEEPEDEVTTTTREFPVGDAAEQAWDYFTDLKALRDLGELSDDERKKFGVDESTDNITAVFSDGERSLILGGKIYGSQDRYVLDTESNHVYALAGEVLRSLKSGETTLRVKNLHKYKPDEVQKVRVSTPAGDERNLIRITVPGAKVDTKTWANAETPDKPDQTMANFLAEIDKVKPARFHQDLDPKTLTPLLTIEYRDGKGAEIGHFEMYKKVKAPEPKPEGEAAEGEKPGEKAAEPKPGEKAAEPKPGEKAAEPKPGEKAAEAKPEDEKAEELEKAEYYVRTERTRVLGTFGHHQGEQLESDLKQMFEK